MKTQKTGQLNDCLALIFDKKTTIIFVKERGASKEKTADTGQLNDCLALIFDKKTTLILVKERGASNAR